MEDIQYIKNEVLIIGAGGLGREILSWHNTSNKQLSTKIIGFLDDNAHALDNYDINLKVLGDLDFKLIKKHQSIICAISDVSTKKSLLKIASECEFKIQNYIHESCLVGERSDIGLGFVLLPHALVSCDTKIGDLVLINSGSQIGHDVSIGDFTSIMANVDIGGGAIIGKNVFIGSNAVILPGVRIPDNTRIGAGAVVLRSIKQEGTYFGNPAKKIF